MFKQLLMLRAADERGENPYFGSPLRRTRTLLVDPRQWPHTFSIVHPRRTLLLLLLLLLLLDCLKHGLAHALVSESASSMPWRINGVRRLCPDDQRLGSPLEPSDVSDERSSHARSRLSEP